MAFATQAAASSAPFAKMSRELARWMISIESPSVPKITRWSPTTSPERTACTLTFRPVAASIRSVNHVKYAALAGADIATAPPAVLKALVKHPLTDKGIELFTVDWKKTGQKIV